MATISETSSILSFWGSSILELEQLHNHHHTKNLATKSVGVKGLNCNIQGEKVNCNHLLKSKCQRNALKVRCNHLLVQNVKDVQIFLSAWIMSDWIMLTVADTHAKVSSEAPWFSWQCGKQRTCQESNDHSWYLSFFPQALLFSTQKRVNCNKTA